MHGLPRPIPKGPAQSAAKGITVLVRMKLRPGASAAFEPIARRLIANVAAHEPGCLSFDIQRTLGPDDCFVVVARFADWPALEAHWGSAHLDEATKAGAPLAAAPPEVELFQDL